MSTDSSRNRAEQGASASSSEGQLQKLTEVISRSQHTYRELIDSLDQALFKISLNGEIRAANLRFSDVLGASFQDLIGHVLSEFIESPNLADAELAMPAFLQKGVWTGTLPVKFKKDKELRYFRCWIQALAEEGKVTAVTGWARNVTHQHESEMRFADLFESFREGILFVTPEGRLLDANPALVRILGFDSKKELQGHNFREMYESPEARDVVMRELEEKGFLHDREIVLRRKDGKRIHCLASGFAIRDKSGRAIRLQGTIVDVTERREMEQRLRQEERFVHRLIANFPDLIAVLDCEGRFTYISDQVRTLLGRPPEEFIGSPLGFGVSAEDKAKLEGMLHRLVRGDVARDQVEFGVVHGDGTLRVLLATGAPLFDEDGKITGIVTSARDITEAKHFEQQLAQKERFAAMGQMLAGAAHELNNPLTAILGVSDLLREGATDEVARRQGNLILKQARRAAAVVQNLLAFSRPMTHGVLKLRLDEIVQEALQLAQPGLEQKNIHTKFTSREALPYVQGDRKLLQQVFLNILANAEQSISPLRERGEIDVLLARVGEKIRVTFADNGPGIPREIMAKIFDPFFTTKRPGGGSGLGLTICLAVVKEHGGTIEIDSVPGAGAAVHVFLPAADEKLQVVKAEPASSVGKSLPPQSNSESLHGHTVLIVDDEESIREVLQEGLLAHGLKVHAIDSSEAALAYLETSAREIILCDFNLPGMSGEEFFEQLRARGGKSTPRFVFMTGELVDPALVDRYREKGARVLQKPFQIPALLALLAEILEPQPMRAE